MFESWIWYLDGTCTLWGRLLPPPWSRAAPPSRVVLIYIELCNCELLGIPVCLVFRVVIGWGFCVMISGRYKRKEEGMGGETRGRPKPATLRGSPSWCLSFFEALLLTVDILLTQYIACRSGVGREWSVGVLPGVVGLWLVLLMGEDSFFGIWCLFWVLAPVWGECSVRACLVCGWV